MLDCLITGASVVDGTGAPPRQADVGVSEGRIVSVGPTGEPTRRTLDAAGLVLAPGFVDIHTHYDAQLFWDPLATPSSHHGVTTVVGGNCGFSLAPLVPSEAGYLMRMMARVEGIPLAALEAGLAWDWKSFADYLGALEGRVAVNAGFLAGHSALRRAVMGDAAVGQAATPAQLEAMVRLLHEALSAGALGFSSSQAPTHNDGEGAPVPSRAATTEEILALAGAVAEHPGTTLETILAGTLSVFSDDEVELLTAMSLAANRPINWNLLAVDARNPDRHRHQLDASTRAAERGARVVALTVPYQMRLRLTFFTGFVFDALPGWSELFILPVAERLRILGQPEVRERLQRQAASPEAGILRGLANWAAFEFAETFHPTTTALAGRTVGDVAAERGQDPFDTLLDVVVADELRTGLLPPSPPEDAATWQAKADIWRDERTIVGGSDAGAHLDMMCGGILTTFLLGEAVRERQLLTLEEAVHQVSEVPARLYGLRGRGRVAPGYWADLVLFDPDAVGHGAIRTVGDLPGGASRLAADAVGIQRVLVNGVEVLVDGAPTGAEPGRVLRSGQDSDTVEAKGSRATGLA